MSAPEKATEKVAEKAGGFIQKYWVWILTFLGLLGLLVLLFWFYKPWYFKREVAKE